MNRPIDLFEDPPWSSEAATGEAPRVSPRPCLVASLALVALLLFSMGSPWLTGSPTTALGQSPPLSAQLGRGWFPGTVHWGFLMLVLGLSTAVANAITIAWPRRASLVGLSVLATILLFVVLTEAFVPFVPAAPAVRADYGAWIGAPAVAFAWCCIVVAAALGLHRRPVRPIPGVAAS